MDYEPELGQMIFGQPTQELKVQFEVEQAMDALAAIYRVIGAKDSPWCNTGSRLKWSCFEAHAYSWGDDDQEWNFKWRDFRVSWYKYNGRGMSQNRNIGKDELRKLLTECIHAILHETPADLYE